MTDTVPEIADKAELQRLTQDAWLAFITFTDHLSLEQWTTPTDAAGWTVKDHVAHVTAWDRAVADLLEHKKPIQRTLGVSDAAWTSGSFDPINAEVREHHVKKTVDTVKTERDAIYRRIWAIIDGYSDDDLNEGHDIPGLSKGEQPLKIEFYEYFPRHYRQHLSYIQAIVTAR
jgi:hypothetical protein